MRKLRRLPWRLPKQTPAPTPRPTAPVERVEAIERPVPTQPVAYIGGRYVYGHGASVDQPAEVRRTHVRHRVSRMVGSAR